MCFFTGLSFLKRLPNLEEISEQGKAIDIEKGFRMKDTFIELRQENKTKCQSDL